MVLKLALRRFMTWRRTEAMMGGDVGFDLRWMVTMDDHSETEAIQTCGSGGGERY